MSVDVNIYAQMLDNCAKDMQHDTDKMLLAKKNSMQDIHKIEIIPSLLAGCKVRRKAWKDGLFLERTQSIDLLMQYYRYDDWEAEPPKKVMRCIYTDEWFEDALSLIRHDKCRFMRCTSADERYFYTIGFHNGSELWHLDIEKDMKPTHPAVFHGDDDMFRKAKWSVCVFE